jgi:hypothetical protein
LQKKKEKQSVKAEDFASTFLEEMNNETNDYSAEESDDGDEEDDSNDEDDEEEEISDIDEEEEEEEEEFDIDGGQFNFNSPSFTPHAKNADHFTFIDNVPLRPYQSNVYELKDEQFAQTWRDRLVVVFFFHLFFYILTSSLILLFLIAPLRSPFKLQYSSRKSAK